MHLELADEDDELEPVEHSANGNGNGSLPPSEALTRGVDRIILATEHMDANWIGSLAQLCRERHVKLSVVSPLRGRAGAVPRLSEVADLPVLEYDTRDVSR